ncbi:hypothetical protein Tco_0331195 [Tanacetum coccineum]
MHEDFVATVYPQVHENLKLTKEEHIHIENPPSSSGTLSSMKNLDDALTFGDQFLNDKPTEEEPGKANVETEVESMVTVPIHQASSSAPQLSTPIIDLTPPNPISPPVQEPIFTATTATTTITLPLPPSPLQQSTTVPELATRVFALEKICATFEKKNKLQDKTSQALSSRVYTLENHDLYSKIEKYVNEVVKEAVHNTHQAPIHKRFKDLSEFKMKEILRDRMFESGSYISHPEHTTLYEALEASIDRENKEEFNEEMAKSPWKTSDTREAPSSSSKQKSASLSEQPFVDVQIPDDVHLSDSEDTGASHLPKIKTRPDWLKPLPKEDAPKAPEPDWVIPPNDLPETENNWADTLVKTYRDPEENKLLRKTRDMRSFIKWYCKQIGSRSSSKLIWKMEECHFLLTDQIDLLNPEGNRVVHNISKPLPLGGPPGHVTIQTQYFFNKDLKYLVSGDKERRNALSISKLKVAYYPDFGLEESVPSLWIESERNYDISAAYGISHWWFKRKEFYITRHSAPSNRSAIVLRRADYKEYKISKADFKNLHPNDFEDLYLLHLQGKLNHLSRDDKVHLFNAVNFWIRNIVIRHRVEDLQLGIKSYQTKLNLTQPRWDATDFLFKEDYTIVHKPRVVIYKHRNNQKKMMRETEVHKFSDGTLTRILEKLDVMVKDYVLFKFNPGMEHRIWSEDDKRRSQEFIKLTKRRLKIRRIFRSLESFVRGRLRDVDYRLIQRTE